MKPINLLLLPIAALALSSCVVEVPSSETNTTHAAGQTARHGQPTVHDKPNGDIQVTYPGKGRHVLFDRYGNLKAGGPGCSDEDLFRAKQAVRSHLAEKRSNFNDV